MKLATNASPARRAARRQRPSWRISPVDDHAHPVGERRRVLEVVRDEQRRQPQLREQLGQLAPNDAARVRVERRERLVEQQHGRVARERPRERDPLALAAGEVAGPGAGEVRDPEALEQLVDALAAAEGDVATDVEVREERVLLEDEPDRAPLGRQIDAGVAVEPELVAERDPPDVGPQQPGDRAQHARLPRSRRPDERERLAPDLELYREAEGAKRVVEAEVERVHEGTSLTARRTAALTTTSSAPIASARSKSTSNCS